MKEIQYLNDKIKTQHKKLPTTNKGLANLLIVVHEYTVNKYGIAVLLTCIERTQLEQDSIYKDDAKYKKRKFKSPHQLNDAADLRSRVFTAEQIIDIEDFINNNYNKTNIYKWTAKCHNVGQGDHFHIQYRIK